MSEETTVPNGGSEVLPVQTADVTNTQEEQQSAASEEQLEQQKKRNRTKEFIERRNREVAELRREVEDLRKRVPKEPDTPSAPPKAEDFGYDFEQFAKANTEYTLKEARSQWEKEQQEQMQARTQSERMQAYTDKARQFASEHDDFDEMVGSIDPALMPSELAAAIVEHPNGPQIAYSLAQDEEALFNLAGIRPELMGRALARYASRLSAAQPQQAANAQHLNPITQAPPPTPRVSGRSNTAVNDAKLTDDDWYRRDREQRRKR